MQTITVPAPNFIEELDVREGFTVDLMVDDSPVNPRRDYDHFVTLVNRNSRTIDVDDDSEGLVEVWDHFDGAMFAHYRRTGHWDGDLAGRMMDRYVRIFRPDIVFWDCWEAGDSFGFGYVTRKAMHDAGFHAADPSGVAAETFTHEVMEYDQWARGEVYGVIVTNDATGEEASLWGIYDDSLDRRYIHEVANDLIEEVA